MLVLHVAYEAHLADLIGFVTVLIADNEAVVQRLGIHAGTLAATHVGAGEHHILDIEFLADIRHEQRRTVEVVDGDIEEALDLVSVEVHRDDAVYTGNRNHVGDKLRCYRHMGLVLAVLTGEAVIRYHGDDLLSRSALGSVDHHQQLEEVVRRGDSALDNEHDTAANSLLVRRLKFTVGILENRRVAQRDAIDFRHAACQVFGGATGENKYFVRTHAVHYSIDLRYFILF